MGTNTSVLLLGEAQVPGSLVLSAADSGAFGDVPIGTTTSRSFVLANPAQVPSGRVTISSDNPRFETDLGDCNQGDPAGLVDGTSCTFNVRFTPNDNLPQAANLSVQSPGAGRAGLQLSGRGRQPALLVATGNRDLGRANVGQDAIREALNEFTWTVNNQGDLPTGTLTVQNDNGPEFAIRDDSCSSSAVLGRASCQMIIRFRPSAAGTRSAQVVVTDPSGAAPATLALTGLGVQLAGLGQSCVNAECSAGVCTRGVCCDRPCDRTCQACSAQGECIDQSGQEACGNGAACFGVDNCKLPAGGACSQNGGDLQCGSGQCERRLGGTGAGDRICCLDDCGNSLQCNGQSRCQAPSLGAGEACGAAGQLACAAGLECKECRGGGRFCTAPADCCGGCDNPLECSNGACVCPVLSNGQRGIDCGGVCAISREGACCVGFEPAGCNCDPGDNLCKQCLDPGDCAPGPAGTRAQCTNNSCSYPCDTQNGFRSCNGTCIAGDQCCQDTDCGNPCQACNTNSHTCGALGGRPDRCPGPQVCSGNGQCVQCTSNAQCAAGFVCTGNVCVSAGAPPGSPCSQDTDCQSNDCRDWSPDSDNDGFGEEGVTEGRCGPPGPGFVDNDEDCCDGDAQARPTQRGFLDRERSGCGGFDFDCDGDVDASPPVGVCSGFGADDCPLELSTDLACGQPLTVTSCLAIADGCQAIGARGLGTNQTCN
jgi:Cys-rich repeat protein